MIDVWVDVVGQDAAVRELRSAAADPVHAYLLLGPTGSGKRAAARAFAATVLAAAARQDPERAMRLAHGDRHPDLVMFEPTGRTLRVGEAKDVIREAHRSPVEGARKVIVVERFHSAEPPAAASLLKTLEEPPDTAILVLLSEDLPPEHVTVASRCVVVPFQPVPLEVVEARLVADGADHETAAMVALAARGDLRRATLLATDPAVAHRHRAWTSAPHRLDGTGFAVTELVDELTRLIDEAQGPLDERQRAEIAELDEREEQLGIRGSGRTDLVAHHKREVRRLRVDELTFGLATLANVYREVLEHEPSAELVAAIGRLRDAADALVRNPNETLLLQALFCALPPVHGHAAS